jgi:beta-lactamase superfamily II metal-dependent hydrolase
MHLSCCGWRRGIRALLGADLEHTGRTGEGWTAVMDCHQDTTPAHIFKVPHHGSKSSDNADVWQRMLAVDPVAVVTPFTGGRVRLPTGSDLKRFSSRTSKLYCTAKGAGKPPSREPPVDSI